MKRKHLTETPVYPRERLVIISYTTGLSFALERIGPLAVIVIIVFYLLVLYLIALPNTPENPFASIYSESLIKTTCQHLLLLFGFDTLIYRKYYDTPPILVGHQTTVSLVLSCAVMVSVVVAMAAAKRVLAQRATTDGCGFGSVSLGPRLIEAVAL
jgi:hypothetical protein